MNKIIATVVLYKYYIIIFSLIVIIFTACGTIEKKAKEFEKKAKSKGKELIDTAINKAFPNEKAVDFSIRSIVKDFQNEKNIIEIKGAQIENSFLYVEYCVYKGKKTRVLNGVNKIVAKKGKD
jgi:hypothetical protein